MPPPAHDCRTSAVTQKPPRRGHSPNLLSPSSSVSGTRGREQAQLQLPSPPTSTPFPIKGTSEEAIFAVMATKTVVSNQKKRALQALERRFAVAKVEAQHQQIRNKRRCDELDWGLKSAAGPSKSSLEAAPAVKKGMKVLCQCMRCGKIT